MRRYFKSILVLIFVGLLLTGAGKAQTLSDTESEMLLDSLSDWADFPDDQEVTSRRLAGIRVGIDPGHQEQRNREKEAIAPDSKKVRDKVAPGTRGTKTGIPEYVTVLEISFVLRARMMNALGVDLVLRIHCNGSSNPSANGIGLYVNKSYAISAESRRAAECILPRMAEATGARQRGIFLRDTYTGLNWSAVPAILVECGYLTNPVEDEKLNDPAFQQKLAEGMVEGICDYFESLQP